MFPQRSYLLSTLRNSTSTPRHTTIAKRPGKLPRHPAQLADHPSAAKISADPVNGVESPQASANHSPAPPRSTRILLHSWQPFPAIRLSLASSPPPAKHA